MNIKKHLNKQPCRVLCVALALCFTSCEGDDSDGSSTTATKPSPVFEAGFNPRTLQLNSQVWLVGSDGSNFVSSVVSSNTINYRYTFGGKSVSANGVNYTFSSLGKSATLRSTFNLSGNQSVYDALTAQLANSSSALSQAVAALDINNTSTIADVIKAAGDAFPGLILFSNNGLFYTIDSLELSVGNSKQGTQTLIGTPILFTNSTARRGTASPRTQVSSVEVSYRNSFH